MRVTELRCDRCGTVHPHSFWEFIGGLCVLAFVLTICAALAISSIRDKPKSVSSCVGHGGLKQTIKTGDDTYNSSLLVVCVDGYTFRKEF